MNKPTIQDALEWLRADRDDYTDEWDRACIARAIGALMTAESVIPRLTAINAELLAACQAYVRLIGNCGDPTQYSGSFANLLAAIEKAKQ